MSHEHDDHEQHDHDCHHGHGHDHDHGHGGPDTSFLDLEMSKVLYSEAETVTREAYRELLKEAAKRHLEARWGDRISALAKLAVDELIDDAEASLAIEAQIEARNHSRQAVEDRVSEIMAMTSSGDQSDDANDDPA
jgi:hypothetical protein